ncbi:S-layer homology domain-containing protein [Anaerotignum sp.]|uniref:S-layer homology domain-containing protein n=1 Tax=Anaerotignum sp. TaxID=2039241 RepID=UPI0027147395|nr:S-layer homology domain-containing protein [Anaerotignum sp.]
MKRLIAVAMALLMIMGSTVPVFADIVTNADPWAEASMEYAYNQGLVSEGDLLDAKRNITRLEFCKIVVLLYENTKGEKLAPKNKSPFIDCDDSAVIVAYEAGIISGTVPNKFEPNKSLTREQLAIMLNRILNAWDITLAPGAGQYAFSDISILMKSSIEIINKIKAAGILVGENDGKFYPMRELTFQEAVIGLVKAYRYAEKNIRFDANNNITDDKENEAVNEEVVSKEKPMEEEEASVVESQKNTFDAETVYINEKAISLEETSEQLTKDWGQPDRIDTTVYGLKRYVYIGDYDNYFFVTLKENKIVEVFVPTKHFSYLGTVGEGTSADIKKLNFISLVEHSGIIETDTTHASIPLDYEGTIRGIWLRDREFAYGNDLQSGLTVSEREIVEKELLDLIQVKRKEQGLPLLTEVPKLSVVAVAHSKDMVENDYFGYTGSNGSNPFTRIIAGKILFTSASEVIVKQRGDVTNVYQQWIRTAAQFQGLLDPSVDSIGVGVGQKGKDLYVTLDFCGGIVINN